MSTSTPWSYERYCDAVADEVTRCAEAVRGADPATQVPTCPGWTMADLIEHLGAVHRWAGQMVREGAPRRLAREKLDLGLPDDRAEYPDWLDAGGPPLVDALRAADPDTEMWAWGADRHVRFWARRMLHETTVHRADAELALGHDPAIAHAVAADGIDELFDNLPPAAHFAPKVKELYGDGETISLRAADAGTAWLIRLRPDGYDWARLTLGAEPSEPAEPATVTVDAAVGTLLLLNYGRVAQDDGRITTTGDRSLLTHWLTNSSI